MTGPRTYDREVPLPMRPLGDWSLLERVDARVRRHADEIGWAPVQVRLRVVDTDGSVEADSVAQARSVTDGTRHRVRRVDYRIGEHPGSSAHPREVTGSFARGQAHALLVSGAIETEVVGLATVLEEMVRNSPRSKVRISWRRSFWLRYLVLPLLVAVGAGLIVGALSLIVR